MRRRDLIAAIAAAPAVAATAGSPASSAAPPVTTQADVAQGELWVMIPASHEAMFTDLAKRLGGSEFGATARPSGQLGPGRILVWVDERAWDGLISAARGLRVIS